MGLMTSSTRVEASPSGAGSTRTVSGRCGRLGARQTGSPPPASTLPGGSAGSGLVCQVGTSTENPGVDVAAILEIGEPAVSHGSSVVTGSQWPVDFSVAAASGCLTEQTAYPERGRTCLAPIPALMKILRKAVFQANRFGSDTCSASAAAHPGSFCRIPIRRNRSSKPVVCPAAVVDAGPRLSTPGEASCAGLHSSCRSSGPDTPPIRDTRYSCMNGSLKKWRSLNGKLFRLSISGSAGGFQARPAGVLPALRQPSQGCWRALSALLRQSPPYGSSSPPGCRPPLPA